MRYGRRSIKSKNRNKKKEGDTDTKRKKAIAMCLEFVAVIMEFEECD